MNPETYIIFGVKFSVSDIILLLTLLAALGTALIFFCQLREMQNTLIAQREITKESAISSLFTESGKMIIADPTLFALYGVNLKDLSEHGIKPNELSFIINDLWVGEIYYRIEKVHKVKLKPYREHFLSNYKVQLAWKKFIEPNQIISKSPFTEAVSTYIAEHPASPPQSISV